MKNSSKLPIGVAIMLTMMVVGVQKGSIFNATASAAETKQEETVSQESVRTETASEEFESRVEAQNDEPENQELTSAETEKEVFLKQKSDKSVARKEKSELHDTNQTEKTSEKSEPNEKYDETLGEFSEETGIKAESEDKIESENQVPKAKTVAKGNGKSVEENTSEIVKKGEYNVEFTYDNLQYVLKGGTSVELREILNKVGLSGTPTNAVSSNDDLFVVDKVFGEWVVKSRNAFTTKETLSVTIGETVYNILVTDEQSGQCGDNLTWTFSDSGVLTISGTGRMYDYAEGESPWYQEPMRHEIKSVVVESGATTIGNNAFAWCDYLTNVTLPDSVTSIGENAFYYNINLSVIQLPSALTSIGEGAFYQCRRLESINIPDGVTTIENDTFGNCKKLTSVTIPDSVVTIKERAFQNCGVLGDVTLPPNLTTLGSRAFAGCNSFERINLPSSLTTVGDHAFWLMGYPGPGLEFHTDFYSEDTEATFREKFPDYDAGTASETTGFQPGNGTMSFHFKYGITYSGADVPDDAPKTFYSDDGDITLPDPINLPSGSGFGGWYDNASLDGDAIAPFHTADADSDQVFYARILTNQNVSFSGDLTKTYTATPFTTALEGYTEGTPEYASSDPAVATIDDEGNVTMHKAGQTTITGSIPETKHYFAVDKSYVLTVNRASISPSVTIDDWTYGEEPNTPEVTGNTGGGTVTFTYDSTSSTPPSNAGQHTLKATIAQTDVYEGGEASTSFTINKASINPSVSIQGWTYGEDPKVPEVTGNIGGGAVTFTYDSTSSNPPKNAGEHTLKATIAETNNYLGGEASTNFSIAKADNPAKTTQLEVDTTAGGNKYNLSAYVTNVPSQSPDVSTVTYSITSAAQGCSVDPDTGAFTTGDVLTGVNPVIVKVSVGETENYKSKELNISVNVIEKGQEPLDVSQESATYGETLTPPSYTKPSQSGTETLEYTGTLRDGTPYGPAAQAPTESGTYNVKVRYETSDKIYEGNADFEISPKNISDAVVTLLGHLVYNGQPQTQAVQSIIVNGENIMDLCNIEGNEVLNAGNYSLTATIMDDTGNYAGFVTKAFTVDKAPSEVGEVTADDLVDTLDPAEVVFHRQDETIPGTFSLVEDALSYGTHTYNWVFTPDDTQNYETATGTVTITVTNTEPEPEPEPDPEPKPEPMPEPEVKPGEPEKHYEIKNGVQTGDSSNLSLWASLLAASPIGYFLNRKRKKK